MSGHNLTRGYRAEWGQAIGCMAINVTTHELLAPLLQHVNDPRSPNTCTCVALLLQHVDVPQHIRCTDTYYLSSWCRDIDSRFKDPPPYPLLIYVLFQQDSRFKISSYHNTIKVLHRGSITTQSVSVFRIPSYFRINLHKILSSITCLVFSL
jgi:hypothetical protein